MMSKGWIPFNPLVKLIITSFCVLSCLYVFVTDEFETTTAISHVSAFSQNCLFVSLHSQSVMTVFGLGSSMVTFGQGSHYQFISCISVESCLFFVFFSP